MKDQITKTLPRNNWEGIVISENNEPLVEMVATNRIQLSEISDKPYETSFFVRKTVADKLVRVSETLPEGLLLVIMEGYRSTESQQKLWDEKYEKLQKENPTWPAEQIEQQVRLLIAKPLPLANHHCGGAIDVTLAYDNGEFVDMGTPYIDLIEDNQMNDFLKKIPMLSEEITEEQKINRAVLRNAMDTEDFVWYPGEWWHYCFGDRMWAVYSGKGECVYGSVDLF